MLPRKIIDIYNDLAALAPASQTAIWNDLNVGSPKKYSAGYGVMAGAVRAHHAIRKNVTLAGQALTEQRLLLAACYVYDNPLYLVNPPFAPGVNVPGAA